MEKVLFAVATLILIEACCCLRINDVDLSTPQSTLITYYEGYKRGDFECQRITLKPGWTQSVGKERFDIVKPILLGYQIIEIREDKDRKENTFHLPEGDIEVLVKEIDKDNKESLTSFVLRKFDSKWLIVDWVTLDSVDIMEEDGK